MHGFWKESSRKLDAGCVTGFGGWWDDGWLYWAVLKTVVGKSVEEKANAAAAIFDGTIFKFWN